MCARGRNNDMAWYIDGDGGGAACARSGCRSRARFRRPRRCVSAPPFSTCSPDLPLPLSACGWPDADAWARRSAACYYSLGDASLLSFLSRRRTAGLFDNVHKHSCWKGLKVGDIDKQTYKHLALRAACCLLGGVVWIDWNGSIDTCACGVSLWRAVTGSLIQYFSPP